LQGIAFDITPLKRAEQELQTLNQVLNQRVAERTAEVEHRAAELARSMAELGEKTDELETFAYVASHDLREPLRTLVNYPQRLLKQYGGKLDEQADDWINRIIDGGVRMRKLIDALSQYSRILRRDRVLVPVDCAEVFAQARADLGAALQQSGAELTAGALPQVLGNEQQLTLLFMNLIGNAVKFCCPERPVRVEVGCRQDADDWLFWVRDNGIGIEAKYLQRIFGLGERLYPASRYPGTGFGLAICEKIIAGHGGRIWAESEPGQGSIFYFTLPATLPGG
jgi:light-regulated signal transduction histidine kinase (bacteriophytochrome)